ncbi:hypothetical protein WJX72_007121 [[Myrmecia] bisecta]|uniref:Uncharacterized protein n=1 Tax=[Myrmecia] bisecta TaxID=41462 RepID=A0AAW1QFH9_9CHLO
MPDRSEGAVKNRSHKRHKHSGRKHRRSDTSKKRKSKHKSREPDKHKKRKDSKRNKDSDNKKSKHKRSSRLPEVAPLAESQRPTSLSLVEQAALELARCRKEAEEQEAARAAAEAQKAAWASAQQQALGPKRKEIAEREANRVKEVWDPETHRMRLVRDGEIVEQMESREEQEARRHAASQAPTGSGAPGVATNQQKWLGRDRFPSQHPWFGYK